MNVPNSDESRNPERSPEALGQLLHDLREDVQVVLEKVTKLSASDDSDVLLTRQEAADRLRVSTRTLDDLEASGRLQAVRIGRRVLYHPETLDAFIRQQSREGRR